AASKDGSRGSKEGRLRMVAHGALCVPLTPRTLNDVFSADLSRADCVEVRLDYLENPRDSVHARWDRLPIPVIATCRGKERGGHYAGSIKEKIPILKSAVENGARYVDIVYQFAPPFPGPKVIVSFHVFAATPADLSGLMQRICESPG